MSNANACCGSDPIDAARPIRSPDSQGRSFVGRETTTASEQVGNRAPRGRNAHAVRSRSAHRAHPHARLRESQGCADGRSSKRQRSPPASIKMLVCRHPAPTLTGGPTPVPKRTTVRLGAAPACWAAMGPLGGPLGAPPAGSVSPSLASQRRRRLGQRDPGRRRLRCRAPRCPP